MDFRIGYRRPLRTVSLLRKKRQRLRLCLIAAVAVAAIVVASTWENAPAKAVAAAAPATRLALATTAAVTATSAARPVYPYSIVPGGVATRADLERRVRTDQVVARHYASFDIRKAHPLAVAKARAVHVSYRKGDKVYWTRNKVMLAAGETVLSDGASEIRGRCGNRISDTAQLPVAMNEPTAMELDSAMNAPVDGEDDGHTQTVSMGPDDALPSGSATQFQHLAAYAQADPAPATPFTKTAMPAMPAFNTGATDGMGIQGTRYLTVSAGPTVALGPTTEGAFTVTPTASTGTPATPADPVAGAPATTGNTTVPAATGTSPGTIAGTVPASAATPNASTPAAAGPAASTPVTTPVKAPLPEGEVPEPATLWLSAVAFAAMLAAGRRKARQPASK